MREMVGHLQRLYEAFGCATQVEQDRVRISEQGLAMLSEYVIVAGLARAIQGEQVRGVQFVVVEDDPPPDHLARLQRASEEAAGGEVLNFTRFVDRMWDGRTAARAAQEASELAEDLRIESFLGERTEINPNRRYVSQRIRPFQAEEGERGSESALSVVESSWLSGGGGPFVVLAGAGVGKSELAVVLQWRSAYQYETVAARDEFEALPPVAIRIPLRELRSFSIESVAGYLASRLKLDRLRSQPVLAALLDLGRIALVLDGLEELPVSLTERDAGLTEFARVAERGAKILLTARTGYYGSQGAETAVLRAFPPDCVWSLESLDSVSADKLLKVRGATREESARVFALLPNVLHGVPLFAIWAWRVIRQTDVDAPSQLGQGFSRAGILSRLVELFCERDEHRVRIPANVQLDALQMIAVHSAMFGSVSAEEVAASVGDAESPFVRGPHALLMRDDDGNFRFRDATLESLMLAEDLRTRWERAVEDEGEALLTWIDDRLGEYQLPILAADHLAQLLSPETIRAAWSTAAIAPIRYRPFARRNILAVALARLHDEPSAGPPSEWPRERVAFLGDLLGSLDLSDTNLIGLDLEMLDFAGWDLQRCLAVGARIAFCSFVDSNFDDSLYEADIDYETCRGLRRRRKRREVTELGQERLRRALIPWHNQSIGAELKPRVDATTPGLDVAALRVLNASGLIVRERSGYGRWFWQLTGEGKALLSDFVRTPTEDHRRLQEVFSKLGRVG